LAPRAEKWRQDKIVDRAAWRALGDMGALLPSVGNGHLGPIGRAGLRDPSDSKPVASTAPQTSLLKLLR
jgi:acyl-CoA dehydrogenase